MRAFPRSLIAACAVALAVATSCSGSGSGRGSPRPRAATVGRWVASPAAVEIPEGSTPRGSNPQLERVIAVPGGWAALGTVDDGSAFAAWRSADGIHWRLTQHDPVTTARGFPGVGTIVERGADLVAAGAIGQQPAVWVSRDRGTSWSRVQSPALTGGGDIGAATVVHNAVVFVGSRAIGTQFSAPAAWSTRDLVHYSRAPVPAPPSDEFDAMNGVIVVGSRVIAVGVVSQHPGTWASDGAGASWTELPATAADGALQQVVELRGHLVANGEHYASGGNNTAAAFVWQANPDRPSWQPIPRSTGAFGDGEGTRGGGITAFRSAAVMTGVVNDRADPNFCYDDLATCDQQSPALLLSTDGRTWGRVAVTGATAGDSFSTVATDPSGLLVIGTRAAPDNTTTNRVWRWTGPSSAVPSSVVPPEELPKQPRHELITDYNASLDVGRTYRFPVPLGSSCGGGTLSFNATMWKVTHAWGDAPYPKSWPVRHTPVSDGPTDYLYGTVRIVDRTHLHVGIENGPTLRTYAPTTEHQLACG